MTGSEPSTADRRAPVAAGSRDDLPLSVNHSGYLTLEWLAHLRAQPRATAPSRSAPDSRALRELAHHVDARRAAADRNGAPTAADRQTAVTPAAASHEESDGRGR